MSPKPVMGTEQDVIGSRVAAFIIDHILSIVIAVVGTVAIAVGLGTSSRGAIYLLVFAFLFGYFIVLEGLFGQTVGKKIMGIMVVRTDGSQITMGASVARNLLRIVDGIASYALGLVVMLMSDKPQRIGDHVADTIVVKASSSKRGDPRRSGSSSVVKSPPR